MPLEGMCSGQNALHDTQHAGQAPNRLEILFAKGTLKCAPVGTWLTQVVRLAAMRAVTALCFKEMIKKASPPCSLWSMSKKAQMNVADVLD